jgi:hypothetical protein
MFSVEQPDTELESTVKTILKYYATAYKITTLVITFPIQVMLYIWT